MIETWKAWVMLAFGVLIGAVLIYVWPWPLVFVATKKDWVEVLSTIATVAAVVVAIGIALYQRSASTSAAIRISSLAAVAMRGRTWKLMIGAQNVQLTLDYIAKSGSYSTDINDLTRLRDYLKSAEPWTMSEIDRLSGLPSECAFQLAHAIGLVNDAIAMLDGLLGFFSNLTPDARQMAVVPYAKAFTSAHLNLVLALDSIDAAIAVYVPGAKRMGITN